MTREHNASRRGHAGAEAATVANHIEQPRESQTDAALTELRSRIIDLTLPPGSRIDEQLLLSRFQLGRTPAREAINRLAAEGFVTIQPGRGGTFVRPLDFAEMGDIVVARQLVENILAHQCRLEDSSLAADLTAMHREYEQQISERNYLAITEVNERFHLRLHRTVGNSFFYDFAKSTNQHNRRLNVYLYQLESAISEHHAWEFAHDIEEHAAIIRAVAERDYDALRPLLTEHAKGTQRRLVRLLQERAVDNFDVNVASDPALRGNPADRGSLL